MNRQIQPSTIAPPAAKYALAVLAESPSNLLHTSGIVPTKPDGSVPTDIAEQADVVWATIAELLTEAGMTMRDIVSITTYVVAGNKLGPVMAARDRALDGHLVASTLITVPALVRTEWLVEISVVAAT